MTMHDIYAAITAEINRCLHGIDSSVIERILHEIETAPRVFVAGMGRSALAMRGFTMRLMHLGKIAYWVGETTTPGIASGDLLIVGSGSGRTESLVAMTGKAKKIGARLALLTIDPISPIAQLADCVVQIPASSPKIEGATVNTSIQPMGSLFEQCLFIACDACIVQLMQRADVDANQMFARHANLE